MDLPLNPHIGDERKRSLEMASDRQDASKKNPTRIFRARHLSDQCQPFFVARAIDEPANRLDGEFARRYVAFGRKSDEACSERKVPEREQGLIDHSFVLEGGNDIAE